MTKNTSCNCSNGCNCSSNSCCATSESLKTAFLACSVLVGSLIVAGAILVQKNTINPLVGMQPSVVDVKTDAKKPVVAPVAKVAPAPVVSEEAIRKYIESNPKIIIDSVNKYMQAEQAKQAAEEEANQPKPEEIKAIVDEIVKDKSNYSLGNPKGKYIIVEFFDHNCGWCKKTNKQMHKALKTAKNIRWIPIDTPIFGAGSEEIARYVLAAGKQGKYAEIHAKIAEFEGHLNKEAIVKMAKDLKLNVKKLESDANGKEIKGKLEANRKYASKLNIRGVPMLIVNGKINPGALIDGRLEEAVKESNSMK